MRAKTRAEGARTPTSGARRRSPVAIAISIAVGVGVGGMLGSAGSAQAQSDAGAPSDALTTVFGPSFFDAPLLPIPSFTPPLSALAPPSEPATALTLAPGAASACKVVVVGAGPTGARAELARRIDVAAPEEGRDGVRLRLELLIAGATLTLFARADAAALEIVQTEAGVRGDQIALIVLHFPEIGLRGRPLSADAPALGSGDVADIGVTFADAARRIAPDQADAAPGALEGAFRLLGVTRLDGFDYVVVAGRVTAATADDGGVRERSLYVLDQRTGLLRYALRRFDRLDNAGAVAAPQLDMAYDCGVTQP